MADKMEQDERFAKVYQDPRFRTLRKKDKTLKIDKRFQNMFTDDKFTLKYSMDKRGRSRKHLIAEDYKKFYRLEDENKNSKDKNDAEDNNEPDANLDQERIEPEKDKKQFEKNLNFKFGYHRGLSFKSDDENEDENSSSSSSSSESEEEDDQDEELEHDWGELDKDAKKTNETSSRIAICNADWDRINAQDLFVLLNSFKHPTGTINSVRIYYSKFGEERLEVEEAKGPSEFIFGKPVAITSINDDNEHDDNQSPVNNIEKESENESSDDEINNDQDTTEKLRKYQLERLKYFYAVVECDSKETAEIIYNELDGMEYECSSTLLDIRFVPEDMDFDDVRLKEECTSMPAAAYKAPLFTNSALQQSNVKITWDENDPKRKDVFNKAFEEDNEDDIKAYLATSSSEDEGSSENEDLNENLDESEKIDKYKNLITSLERENQKEDYDMEVSWEPKLQSVTKDKVQLDEGLSDKSETDDSDPPPDPKDEKSKKKRFKNKKEIDTLEEEEEDSSNLELLMMDLNDTNDKKKHFNYKNIVENFKKNKDTGDEDGFKFNPDDDRFSSIYNSHLYNIDQSDPNFKRTKAFEEILKKRKLKANQMIEEKDEPSSQEISAENKQKRTNTNESNKKSLDFLIHKVKRKASETFTNKHVKKKSTTGSNKFNINKKFRR